jgi:hypothetical protein
MKTLNWPSGTALRWLLHKPTLCLSVIAVFVFAMTACRLTQNVTNTNSTSDAYSSAPIEKPSPTAAQLATLATGQTVSWNQKGITLRVPPDWKQSTGRRFQSADPSDELSYASNDGSVLTVSAHESSSFELNELNKNVYLSGKGREKDGKAEEVRRLELSGMNGVSQIDTQNKRIWALAWHGERKTPAGAVLFIDIVIEATPANFPQHKDQFYAILYSTTFQ